MNFPAFAIATALALSAIHPLAAHEPTLFLMGGSYRTCSSLDTDDCLPNQSQFPEARQASLYKMNPDVFTKILDPAYWQTRDRPPAIAQIRQLLETAHARAADRTFQSSNLSKLLESVDAKTWQSLVTPEQDMILSAFEIPQIADGVRRTEGVALDGSNKPYDAQLFRRFVQDAAKRSPGKKPRVAFVTSAAANNFDAVDFYIALLNQAGAEVVWWPIDASMNAALFGEQGCAALPQLRQRLFSQLERERVFPDLAAQQAAACADSKALAELPKNVQGLFLDGGDQWLHWNTFFTPQGQANLWLQNIRSAYQSGNLVVAGTSAGTAIQSGPAMITNGTSANALSRGAKIYGGMYEGCETAGRCPDGFKEDDFTYWPNGGLSLAGPLLMDTHVSERKREMRLLTLLNAVDATTGIGVDETSAVMLRFNKSTIEVEALGMSGAWWMMKPTRHPGNNSYHVQAHYLAPGRVLQWQQDHWQNTAIKNFTIEATGETELTDAISGKGLREAVWNMARLHQACTELTAGDYRVLIRPSPESRYWQGPDGQQGITDLKVDVSEEQSTLCHPARQPLQR